MSLIAPSFELALKKTVVCFVCEKKERISQYKGVTWHKNRNKWYVQLRVKGEKQKYGGMFNDELDAARRANQLCQEFGVPLQNPTISGIPNQRYQVTKNFVLSNFYCEKIKTVKVYFFNQN